MFACELIDGVVLIDCLLLEGVACRNECVCASVRVLRGVNGLVHIESRAEGLGQQIVGV